jgi:PAS domain-containing protein
MRSLLEVETSSLEISDVSARNGMAEAPIPQSVLDASGVVGTWVHDYWAGQLALSASLATLLGLDPEAAARGVSLEAFLDRTHPEDRIRIESYLHAVAGTGGPMEAEFRTRDTRTGIRTLLMRGRIERDPAGRAIRGRGIAIDRTEEQAANLVQSERVVNRMAEHIIALRDLARALHRPALTDRIEHLMIEIGFELARFLPEPEDEPRH